MSSPILAPNSAVFAPDPPFVVDVAGHMDNPDRLELYYEWEAEFRPLLGSTARWTGFCYLMRYLLGRERPVIVETGTLRQPGNWKGDGQSTRLWQWVVERKSGLAVSVDVESTACDLARRECPSTHVVCQDSVTFLRGFFPFAVDLLYLDSREWGPGAEMQSAMHQVAELSAIYERLPSGCLIASDDSHSADQGKPALTRRLLHILGIEPVIDSYIVIWRKP
jgi:hypothetical protein